MAASVPAASRHCFEALPSKYSLHDPWDYPALWHLSASTMKFISTLSAYFASHPCRADNRTLLKDMLVLEAASLTAATLALAETRAGLI